MAQGVSLAAVRAAVARMPPDAYQEAQISAREPSRAGLSENPSARELENWVAPDVTYEQEVAGTRLMPLGQTLVDVQLPPDPLAAGKALDILARAADLEVAFRPALRRKLLASDRDARAGHDRAAHAPRRQPLPPDSA